MASLFERGVRKLKREALRKTSVFRTPPKAAIIGCGGIAPSHLHAYNGLGSVQLVGGADVAPGALARTLDKFPTVRGYRDYRQMLRETRPDVVSVCTWPQHRAEIIVETARSGVRGILCEKPLALSLEDMETMIAACREAGVKLGVGHQFRFHPNYLKAAAVIRSGKLGIIRQVKATMSGSLANRGPHLIDTVRFLLGDPEAESVLCQCRRQGDRFLRGLPEEDEAEGEALFRNGTRLELAMGDPHSGVLEIRIEGTGGYLDVNSARIDENGKITKTGKLEFRPRQFREFLQWVKGKRPSYSADAEQGLRSAELVLALYESARQGDRVGLPLANRGSVLEQLYPEPEPAAPPVVSRLPDPASLNGRPDSERLAIDGGRRTLKGWFSNDSVLGASELAAVTQVIMSKKLGSTSGKVTRTLEKEFARLYGSPHAVASTSGTAAIHVALGTINPDPGDEVITTPMSDMGTVIPILLCNAVPVFADVDPVTGNLTAKTIAEKITPRTKAVIVVHLFGRPAEMDPIVQLCSQRGIRVIEDCAQAHFAEYAGKKVGSIGDFGCFSFQSSKQITCGDGGMTLVNAGEYADRASLYADKGFDRKRPSPTIAFLAPNYRMTELQAAVVRSQLKRLPALITARRDSADRLARLLSEVPQVSLPDTPPGTRPAWWRFTFRIDEESVGIDTLDFAAAIGAEGVKTSKEFPPRPLFDHDMLRDRLTYGSSGYPISESSYAQPRLEDYPGFRKFATRVIPIGWSSHVKPEHVKGIDAAIRKVVRVLSRSRSQREPEAVGAGP